MTKEEMMDRVFWHCVDIMNVVASWLGVTYEELNIWVFIIIQPATILVLTLALIWQQCRHKNAFRRLSGRGKPRSIFENSGLLSDHSSALAKTNL